MKIPMQEYRQKFRELAVKLVKDGQRIAAVAKEPGLLTRFSGKGFGSARKKES